MTDLQKRMVLVKGKPVKWASHAYNKSDCQFLNKTSPKMLTCTSYVLGDRSKKSVFGVTSVTWDIWWARSHICHHERSYPGCHWNWRSAYRLFILYFGTFRNALVPISCDCVPFICINLTILIFERFWGVIQDLVRKKTFLSANVFVNANSRTDISWMSEDAVQISYPVVLHIVGWSGCAEICGHPPWTCTDERYPPKCFDKRSKYKPKVQVDIKS